MFPSHNSSNPVSAFTSCQPVKESLAHSFLNSILNGHLDSHRIISGINFSTAPIPAKHVILPLSSTQLIVLWSITAAGIYLDY